MPGMRAVTAMLSLSCRMAVSLSAPTFGFGRTAVSSVSSHLPASSLLDQRGKVLHASRRGSMSMAVEAPARSEVITRTPAQHPAFELVRVEMVDEYTIKCATYRHIKSGAEVISAQADDDNKVFGIVFRTPVTDSTGVPHILEHSVLCGSDRYTSKEPFVELLKGSLQTFLNAFTYPDRTCYPVASQNTKDFYNLVNVYLDAVLNPRAMRDPTVLKQEGWHYELEQPDEPLTYKGVVFNEMKGVYSSPDSRMFRAAQQATFPDNTYSVDSGGDPLDIPTLTFDQFKGFHEAYYHPANSRIFFYGDDDLDTRLSLLDEYLQHFTAPTTPPASEIMTQKLSPPTLRTRVTEKFPATADAGDEGQHMVMVNWLLNEEPLSPADELALGVLDHLLMGTRTSTLYRAMTESGLGAAIMGGGVSDELKQNTFSIGLKGVKPENVDAVEALAISTLEQAVADGFDAEAVEASMNTVEFQLREMNTGGFPKGLAFMLGVLPRWIYRDGDTSSPLDALRFEEPLAELKARLASGERVFESLLQSLIVGNSHRTTVELQPDASLAEKIAEAEKAELAAAKAKMSEEEIAAVIADTAALKAAQLKEDDEADLATIPRVGLADLERAVKTIPTDVAPLAGGGTLLTHPIPTAGVVYADVLLDASGVPLSEMPLMPMLTRLMMEGGTSDLDAVSLQRRIGARTGGISVSTFSQQRTGQGGAVGDPFDAVCMLQLRAKGTVAKLPEMFELVDAILTDAQLDSKAKVVEMLRESKARLESSFISSGNSYAGLRLASRSTLVGYLSEITSGVTYYESVKEMLATAESDWPSLLARFERLRDTLLAQKGLVINLTADPDALEAAKPAVDGFVSALPAEPAGAAHTDVSPWRDVVLNPKVNEAYAITTQVNYVAAGDRLFQPGEVCNLGATNCIVRYLSRGYLWDNVRVVGGAYGGGAAFNPTSGALAFSSYRDPNLQGTLYIYAGSAQHLAELELSDQALEQAIVGAVGDLDQPMTPDQKGSRALAWYLTGVTTEERQKFRDEVLATSRQDFADFAERLKGLQLKVATFASPEAIEAANAARAEGDKLDVTALS